MTINHTRFAVGCWQKIFKLYHQRLTTRPTFSIADGSVVHAGLATALANKSWDAGHKEMAGVFVKEIAAMGQLLPQEEFAVQDNWECCEDIYALYKANLEHEDIQIIQPECEFNVPLTEDKHFCIWKHWVHRETREEIWRPPTAEEILDHVVQRPTHWVSGGDPEKSDCACVSQHSVVGRVDGIWLYQGQIWINDYKTTKARPSDWWKQWFLNYQPTIYMYGVEKAMGIRPKGCIINAVFRPSDAQVAAYNAKRKNHSEDKTPSEYMTYKKDTFLRTDQDVERARREFLWKCEEWEDRIVSGRFPLAPPPKQDCRAYNTTCQFHDMCLEHDHGIENYEVKTDYDYVEEKLYNIAGATK